MTCSASSKASSVSDDDAPDDSVQDAGGETERERLLRKYENNYASRWSDSMLKYDDPASEAEKKAAEDAEERRLEAERKKEEES